MALRFKEKGQYLRSFVADDSLFIDIMMNVGIIFYAARETGDDKLLRHRHAALPDHAARAGPRRRLHRPRGHLRPRDRRVPAPDARTRASAAIPAGRAGWPGRSTASAPATATRRDPRFLETAEACADFYIAHTPSDGVPPWDFDAPPESRKLLDTSAAAIAASGLLQLASSARPASRAASTTGRPAHPRHALRRRTCGKSDPGWEGILKGGVYHMHKDLGVNESVMWGEYFFLEALEKALA